MLTSRLLGLGMLRRPLLQTGIPAPMAIAAHRAQQAQQQQLRLFSVTKQVRQPEAGSNNAKTRAYLSYELMPLYAIVFLAVSAGLYTLGGHLFHDNDIRRLPEHPSDPSHPQARPDWKEMKK